MVIEPTGRVTQPNGGEPPDGNIGGALVHGNGALWVAMPPSNVVVTEPRGGGTIQTMYPWWRSVTGTLRIEGRRGEPRVRDPGAEGRLAARRRDRHGARGSLRLSETTRGWKSPDFRPKPELDERAAPRDSFVRHVEEARSRP